MAFAAVVFTGLKPEASYGPFSTEQAADVWCRAEGIDVESSPRDDDRRRAYIVPFHART